MVQAAGVKKLVLSHMGPHLSSYGPLEKGIGDVRRLFSGEIVFAEELLSVEVYGEHRRDSPGPETWPGPLARSL